jgi:pimeloyl-ACP methyl ester carboxylesterase
MHPFRYTLLTINCVLLASCAIPIKSKDKNASVVHDELARNVVNSSQLSEPVQDFVKALGIGKFMKREPVITLTELEKRLAGDPNDVELRRSICELSIKEARRAESKDPSLAVGLYLTAAEHASSLNDETFRAIVSDSTARVIELLHAAGHDWNQPTVFPGAYGDYELVHEKSVPGAVDPTTFRKLIAADQLDLTGFRKRTRRDGAGTPMVGTFDAENRWPLGAKQPTRGELDLPLNALLDFRAGGKVAVTLHDLTLCHDAASTNARLAADFTAPLAELMSKVPGPFSGIISTIRPNRFEELRGLQFLEPYRPDKIPVILVHGLLGEPTTWRDTCNELMADETVRENYQIWLYRYPTGASILGNATDLRKTLIDAHSYYSKRDRNSKMDEMVLVGYSLGGVISSLQIRRSGDIVWDSFFKERPAQLAVSETERQRLRDRMYFDPLPFVTRAIFIATPHRGSPLVRKPASRLLSSLIRLPGEVLDRSAQVLVKEAPEALTNLGEAFAKSESNGLEELAEESNINTYASLPLSDKIVIHSIIGDQGKGPGPDCSDGWVPYTSSHLDEAASEKIVPCDHKAHHHEQTIDEIRRLLRLHLR